MNIKNKIYAMLSILALAVIFTLFYAETGSAADLDAGTGFQYDWWRDDNNNEASQVHIPLKIDYSRSNYSLSLLTGWANTSVEFVEKGNRSMSNLLDTKVMFEYEISRGLPFIALIGLDMNLPTGKTGFGQDDLILIMDPDLVSITTFGEGFNVSPTLAVAKEWGDLVAGLGVGYLWRGKYDFSDSVNDYDPGDIFNTSAEVRYFFSSVWNGRMFGNYVIYGKDKVSGDDFYQEGDYYQVGVTVNYARTKWISGLTLHSIFRDKSKTADAGGGLTTENNKSLGDEWIGDFTLNYLLNDRTTLKSFAQGLYITKNNYSPDSASFVGRREKYTLGIGAMREFAGKVEAGVTLKGFIMSDAEANYPEQRDSRDYTGFALLLKLTTRFSGI